MRTYISSIKLLSVAFLLLCSISCKKNLDLANPYALSLIPNTAFTNLDDFAAQLNGVYAAFQSTGYYNGFMGCTSEILTDNTYETRSSLANYQTIANWDYVSFEGYFSSAFVAPYNVVYQANAIITRIDAFKTAAEEKKYNRILGQAIAARAIAHFDLLKAFADDFDRNSTKPGIPIKTDIKLETPPRASVKEVYDFIYAELNKAITLLSNTDQFINAANRAAIDVTVARAAMARVAYYAGDYTTAIDNANEVIIEVPLADISEYPLVWTDGSTNEVVWAIQNNLGETANIFPSSDLVNFRLGRLDFAVHPSLLNLYDKTSDVRYENFFGQWPSNLGGTGEWAFLKYLGGRGVGIANFKVFRAAEMYLIRAEAYAKTGDEASANQDLNTLKTNRIDGYTDQTLSGADLLTEIENERRRELALEGHRWFDLKRTTRVVNRPILPGAGGTINANANVKQSLGSNSFKWTWPIPEAEMRINSNMAQNPGY
ncbi:MAG: RagB/SusD family nutrient uptake outer membrane protein [Bacteroidetes bacterium]|nr:RagB/SusD family nutrient uptake outer membrane protein [Bacteroidota bacterium]